MNHLSRSIGQTLTFQEQSNVEIGLIKGMATDKLMSLKFWGKLTGTRSDYIIAIGLIKTVDYPTKKFFFCTNTSPEFQQFPPTTDVNKQKAAKVTGRLTGDPSFLLEEVQESEEEENANPPFREVDRLACIVEEIDREVSIVPCGAYLMGSSHSVVPNNSFGGLNWERATQLSNYYHFRVPEQPERKEIVKSDGLVRATDFLDPITNDLEGSWSLRTDNTKSTVILRNLEYPGYTFFHKPQTGVYGSAYFGNGFKNKDIAFML